MSNKISELKKMCDLYHLDLMVKYYGNSTNFIGFNDNDEEVFNVCVWYRNAKDRTLYVEINSKYEHWRGGQFKKEDILLLLSVENASDEELCIKPREETI